MDANFAKSLKSIPEQNVRPLALKTIARHFPYVERYWKHSPISLNNIHKSKLCALEEKQRCTVENTVETSVRRFISTNLFKNMEFGAACAVLTPCENSHPFEHRRVALSDEPVKIGRSLAKLQASSNNFVFDCKVLSRNHALIWYEDGSFYVRDTKSSNGTFINGQRLSKASEESLPKEVFSGDLIQLGVEIVENTRNGTSFSHGCIVAMLRLYHPNGLEALPRETYFILVLIAYNIDASQAISNQELFQVQQYIREAVYREKIMESKMTALQALLVTTQDATNECWNALIDEDRLLSRIEMLESQLRICSKEAIRRVMQEKLDALQRLGDVEQCLESTVKQCGQLRDDYEAVQKELALVTEQHNECLKRVHDLNKDLEAYIFNQSSYFCMFVSKENLKDTKELDKESTELLLSNDCHVIKKLKSELIDQDSSSENVKQNRDANLNSSNTSVAKCEVEHMLEPSSFADALEFSRKQAQDLTEDLRKAKLELENSQQKALHLEDIFKESLKETDHHADVAEEVLGEWNLLSIASSLDGADGCTDTFSVEDKNNAPQPQLSCNEAEFASLKHECSNLRQRIAAVEKEVKLSAQENSLLQTRYAELLKSYNAVHEEKTVLDEEKSSWLAQLIAANQEADLLRLQCSFFTLLQCIILIVGVVMALLPWFSSLTATLDNIFGE
ncbi:Sarcolemmal membrane-associated protein [Trichinella spiralis]|uniref:Sarcolemmal membrane-associated protein n=1 Tax=Trichinella spiralis TaxID=6334 RepID=A0A0V1C2R5_TRISP|nr:Sarcolemmal membrane-associated protein [Trichinella spiralis]